MGEGIPRNTIMYYLRTGKLYIQYCIEHIHIQVTLSDTSGDEGYDRLRPLSYLDADLVTLFLLHTAPIYVRSLRCMLLLRVQIVLCFSLDSPASLRSASDRWRSELRHFLPSVPVVVVGTKEDARKKAEQRGRSHDASDSAGEALSCATAAEAATNDLSAGASFDELDFSQLG